MEQVKHSDLTQFTPVLSLQKYSSSDLVTKCEAADDLICSICLQFPHTPVECTKCRCHFCSDCVDQWKQKHQDCPNRCNNAAYGKAHPFFFKSLSALKVKCTNPECQEDFILQQATNHATVCKFQEVECQLCHQKLKRKDQEEHLKTCKIGDCEICEIKGVKLIEHNCVAELKQLLRKKETECEEYQQAVKTLNEKVQKLEEQVKWAKEIHRGHKPPSSIENATIHCKWKHKMTMMRRSPYFLRHAVCDSCQMRKISKFCSFFFHCAQCNYDLCPNCAKQRI